MKFTVLSSGLLLFSMTAMGAGQTSPGQPGQQVDLGHDQTYTIDGMKERCRLFQSSAQLKPFSIRVECAKTENRWEAIQAKRPLPQWVQYEASGSGKGMIMGEKVKESLAPQEYECTNYQEKTILYKGYVELSCDQFIQSVTSLKQLCAQGFTGKDGAESQVEWTQVGEAETGNQFTTGCETEIKDLGPGAQKPGEQESGEQTGQEPGEQVEQTGQAQSN